MDAQNIESWLGQEQLLERFMIHPRARSYQVWSFLVALTSFLNSILVSYQASFCEYNIIAFSVSYIFDSIFLVNMVVTFFVAYYNSQGILVVKRNQIAKEYLLSLFILDFINVFPTDLLVGSGSLLVYRLNRVFGVCRCIHYLRKYT